MQKEKGDSNGCGNRKGCRAEPPTDSGGGRLDAGDGCGPAATAEDFLKIGNDENFPLDGTYLLKNDIAITSEAYEPVGTYAAPFTGSFDGNGKTVTLNVTYNNTQAKATVADCAYVGLFGVVKTATVRNLKVAGSMNANTVCGCMGTVIGATNGNCTVENVV